MFGLSKAFISFTTLKIFMPDKKVKRELNYGVVCGIDILPGYKHNQFLKDQHNRFCGGS